MSNQCIGCFQNHAGRAVILLQAQGSRPRKIGFKTLQIFDTSTAPAINRLVIVTNDGDFRITARKYPQPGILNGVGVLKFIHQNVLKALLVVRQQLWPLQPEFMSAQQQLGKIDQPGALALLFIGLVNRHLLAHERITFVLNMLRSLTLVFACIDKPLHLPRREPAFIQFHCLEKAPDYPILVI